MGNRNYLVLKGGQTNFLSFNSGQTKKTNSKGWANEKMYF